MKDIVTTLRALASGLVPAVEEKAMRDAANEIIRLEGSVLELTAERDEARREVSFLRPSVCLGAQTAHEYAESRGWDCFKEDCQ